MLRYAVPVLGRFDRSASARSSHGSMAAVIAMSVVMCLLSATALGETALFLLDVEIVPASPTAAEEVEVILSGLVGNGGYAVQSAVWQQAGSNVLVDFLVVADDIPGGSPLTWFVASADIGLLPVGTYDLRARGVARTSMDPPFPDPWIFPEEVGPDFAIMGGKSIPVTVDLPEPGTLVVLVVAVAAGLARRRG